METIYVFMCALCTNVWLKISGVFTNKTLEHSKCDMLVVSLGFSHFKNIDTYLNIYDVGADCLLFFRTNMNNNSVKTMCWSRSYNSFHTIASIVTLTSLSFLIQIEPKPQHSCLSVKFFSRKSFDLKLFVEQFIIVP